MRCWLLSAFHKIDLLLGVFGWDVRVEHGGNLVHRLRRREIPIPVQVG